MWPFASKSFFIYFTICVVDTQKVWRQQTECNTKKNESSRFAASQHLEYNTCKGSTAINIYVHFIVNAIERKFRVTVYCKVQNEQTLHALCLNLRGVYKWVYMNVYVSLSKYDLIRLVGTVNDGTMHPAAHFPYRNPHVHVCGNQIQSDDNNNLVFNRDV